MDKLVWVFIIGFAIIGPELFGLGENDSILKKALIWGGLFGIIGAIVGSIVVALLKKIFNSDKSTN